MKRKIFDSKRKVIIILVTMTLFYIVNVFINPYYNAVNAVVYRYGSRGDTVYKIQANLKKWGYYIGSIDGIYGYNTYVAVKKFQTKNGLSADGVAGDKTLAALAITTSTSNSYAVSGSYNQNINLLSRLINGEARGEPYAGQVAVGAVVINRTRDPRFPSTIAGVIYQQGAFTATVDGQINAKIEQSSINAAKDALNGWDPSGGAVYYFNPATATNKWIWSRPLIKIIGKHRFCK